MTDSRKSVLARTFSYVLVLATAGAYPALAHRKFMTVAVEPAPYAWEHRHQTFVGRARTGGCPLVFRAGRQAQVVLRAFFAARTPGMRRVRRRAAVPRPIRVRGTAVLAPPPASPPALATDHFPAFLLLIRGRHDGKRVGILRKRGGILRKPLFRTFGRCGGSNRKTAVSCCGGREWDKYDPGGGLRVHPFRAGRRALPGVKTHSCPCLPPLGSGPTTLYRPLNGAFTSRGHKRV